MSQTDSTDKEQIQILRELRTGVMIILWVVLTQVLVWPIGAIVSMMRDKPLLSYDVMTWAAVISAIVAFVCAKVLFAPSVPAEMATTKNQA